MELLVAFAAGLVLASIVAYIALRSVRSLSAAERKRYDEALNAMKEQVQNATNQMLKERQAELQQSNTTNMKQIVEPLKESIAKMETALKENRSTQETSTEAIKEKYIDNDEPAPFQPTSPFITPNTNDSVPNYNWGVGWSYPGVS